MDYQITCICGHSFLVSDDKIRGEVQCPACHQRLSPAVQAPAQPAASPAPTAASTPVATDSAGAEPTKRCPFCGEVILAIAKKCKHCGEFLDRAAPPAGAGLTGAAAALAPNAAASATAPSSNDQVYALNTSQWDNFWRYLVLGALVLFVAFVLGFFKALQQFFFVGTLGTLVFAGFIGWFFYLRAKSTRIRIYPLRIDVETGILSKNLDSLELFRVTDTEFKQSLLERILGIGSIKLMTNDSTSEPELILFQIPRAREVYKYLQIQIPLAAKQRGAVYLEK